MYSIGILNYLFIMLSYFSYNYLFNFLLRCFSIIIIIIYILLISIILSCILPSFCFFFTYQIYMIEAFLLGIILGVIPITLIGLLVTAYLQYRRGDSLDF